MPPIFVTNLFPLLSRRLAELLRSLTPEEWRLPTVSSQRTVKDIASHLLDGSLRRLSIQRDHYHGPDKSSQPRVGEPILSFLNRLNQDWEIATRRLSPTILVDLIEWTDLQLVDLFRSLDPHGAAIFPVAWAGEHRSQNWMDVVREYTEKWHHAQQIFDATGRSSTIMDRELGNPCFDIFMRALPFTYREVEAEIGRTVTVMVTGEAGGSWHIERQSTGWQQVPQLQQAASSTIVMDQHIAWKLLTKRRKLEEVRRLFPEIEVRGDQPLGEHALTMVSVMA